MKYLRKFEHNILKPKIGDYLICKEPAVDNDVAKFTSSNVGKFVMKSEDINYPYILTFNNVPKEFLAFFNIGAPNGRLFARSEFVRYATPEEIEEYELNNKSNKFNL
jgi:hypothetical protein